MSMETESVFSSDITRGCVPNTKDLYNLINIIPAIPVKPYHEPVKNIEFQPKTGKFYVSKRKSKLKVQTVRNIRFAYEADVLSFLPQDLEKQHNYLLRKIKKGSAHNESTKVYAKNLLKSNKPISRQSWQMLMNVNPDKKLYPIQYVLWNGAPIRLNGSKGGKTKYLCKYDLRRNLHLHQKNSNHQRRVLEFTNKKRLLQNSLNVKFRPGPLSKKKYLDESYQKYQLGSTELVKLPTPVLEVYPSTYGITFDESTRSVLNSLRDVNGEVSENWAALATTALGEVKDGKLEKVHPGCCISFELKYKKNQKQILMRNNFYELQAQSVMQPFSQCQNGIESEVKDVITALLDSIEISLQQDILSYDEDDIREVASNTSINSNIKEKTKKKFSELGRLHVTVIELPNAINEEKTVKCENSFCKLGCICLSIECRKILRGHCGRLRCMFSCECDHSMYNIDNNHTEILSELVSLDKQICSKLSKEEQKFHQTVVLSGEQSILLKSKRRDSKAPKKYDDFYSNIKNNENEVTKHKLLSVASFKLDCKNIEPWCMVHNLYKCFCAGKFVDSIKARTNDDTPQEITVDEEQASKKFADPSLKMERRNTSVENAKPDSKNKKSVDSVPIYAIDSESSLSSLEEYPKRYRCSRLIPYAGRKYDSTYYTTTNFKILAMEQNDKIIHKRLLSLIFKSKDSPVPIPEPPEKKHKSLVVRGEKYTELDHNLCHNQNETNKSVSNNAKTLLPSICITDSDSESSLDEQEVTTSIKYLNNALKTIDFNNPKRSKSALVKWLESSYKVYKSRLEGGNAKTGLDPPKQGIMTLYPWEFVLSRYRESKNLFLVTKTRPFRIFMAVTMNHPYFKNCINIDDIRFTDLHQYPVTVRNLLTNVTNLVDLFYIFRGLSFCWELIGSVSKLSEKKSNKVIEKNDVDQSELSLDTDDKESSDSASSVQFNNIVLTNETEKNIFQKQFMELNDSSKWFVMTLENDFSEIQFYKKGFFVKYNSIIKAIREARYSGNTVRLSSQKCIKQGSIPPFGIYAIPSTEEYNVFIGPYEKDEPLGIETIKTILDMKKSKRTRGVWIKTNKIDNLKVIEKPLAFMPEIVTKQMVQLYDDDQITFNRRSKKVGASKCPTKNLTALMDLMSKKSTSFTTTAPDYSDTLIPVELSEPPDIGSENLTIQTCRYNDNSPSILVECEFNEAGTSNNRSNIGKMSKPIAEVAPQMKTIPETQKTNTVSRRPEIGMFILKPEEINKKAMENQFAFQNNLVNDHEGDALNEDIEDFLATSIVCAPPDTLNEFDPCIDVWIECITVNNLGWIPGQRRCDEYLSIEFPGFKKSPFYEEEEAFAKLNQVLERKVFISKEICLKWRVVKSSEDLNSKFPLNPDHLGPNFILTKRGLRHKRTFLPNTPRKQNLKPNLNDMPTIQTLSPVIAETQFLEDNEND